MMLNEDAIESHTFHQHQSIGLIALSVAYFMVLLDTTILNIALSSIEQQLHGSLDDIQWVVSSYTLAFARSRVEGRH